MRVPGQQGDQASQFLKEISLEYTLEEVVQKLKLQHFDHMMERTDSLEKTLMLGKIEDRRRGRQRMRWLTSPSHDQPFPRAVEWRRGDGGGRAGGGLWAHRQRETARNKHQREEPVSEEMNQTAKREFSRTQGIF